MHDTSRDPADLHPALKERWEHLKKAWRQKYPKEPQPFLTTTYRGQIDQEEAFRNKKSLVRFGGSLHNYKPSYAFDIAFLDEETGAMDWSWRLFENAAKILEPLGLEWGGRWPTLRDGTHFQMPMNAEQAKWGDEPIMPSLDAHAPESEPEPEPESDDGEGRKLVVMKAGEVVGIHDVDEAMDVIVRYAPSRKRVYIDVREAGE